jgi:hypothetical protein
MQLRKHSGVDASSPVFCCWGADWRTVRHAQVALTPRATSLKGQYDRRDSAKRPHLRLDVCEKPSRRLAMLA